MHGCFRISIYFSETSYTCLAYSWASQVAAVDPFDLDSGIQPQRSPIRLLTTTQLEQDGKCDVILS